MVTGDLHHTAIAVARGVGMLSPEDSLVIVQSRSELQGATHTASWSKVASIEMQSTASAHFGVIPRQPPSKPLSTGSSFFLPSCTRSPGRMSLQLPRGKPSTHVASAHVPNSIPGSSLERSTLPVPMLGVNQVPKSLSWHDLSRVHPAPSDWLLTSDSMSVVNSPVHGRRSFQTSAGSSPHLPVPSALSLSSVPLSLSQPHSAQQRPHQQTFPQQQSSDSNRQASSEQVFSQRSSAASACESHLYKATPGWCNLASADTLCSQVMPMPLQGSTAQMQLAEPSQHSSLDGLVFTLQSEDHVEELDAQHAITSLAQV